MTTRISCKLVAVIGFAVGVACAPLPTPPVGVSSPPTITVLAHGVVSAAALAADDQRVFVGETQGGARPADTQSRVLSIPVRGGQSHVLSETQRAGAIRGLAAASDGTLFVSRWADPLTASTISAYRSGIETIFARVTDAPPGVVALRSPAGVAMAQSGDLLVADTLGSQVLRITATGQIARLAGIGGCTSGPLTAPSPGAALAAVLCGPELLALDDQGNLYVARTGSRWIAKIDPGGTLSVLTSTIDVAGLATGPLGTLLASDGTRGEIVRFQGGRSSVIVTGVDRPTSVAVGTDGAIFVLAEGSNDLLRIELR